MTVLPAGRGFLGTLGSGRVGTERQKLTGLVLAFFGARRQEACVCQVVDTKYESQHFGFADLFLEGTVFELAGGLRLPCCWLGSRYYVGHAHTRPPEARRTKDEAASPRAEGGEKNLKGSGIKGRLSKCHTPRTL